MAKENPQDDLLPEFEAVLKSVEFLDLDKRKINKLADEELRRVTDAKSIKQLGLDGGSSDNDFIYDNITNRKGLNKFFTVVKGCGSTNSGRNEGTRYFINNGRFLSNNVVKLFDLQNIILTGTDILLISDEKNGNGKPVVFIVNAKDYLKEGVKALQWYGGDLNNLPRNNIRGKNSIPVRLNDYTLQHIGGETLKISKSGCVDNSMDGHSFDVLPKQSKNIEKDVVVNFKSDYLEFFSLKQVTENNTNQIRAEKYQHRGVDYIDYETYGKCVQGILDPNKNFIIGIFESGGKRSLKILRLDASAELMESFDNIDEFVGFDNDMDIIAYDHDGKLRKIDANFNNYPLYTTAKLVGLRHETTDQLTEVIGVCKTYPDMFGSAEYAKAVAIVLGQNNLASKEMVKDVLGKVVAGEYITRDERDNLGYLLHPDNPALLKTGNTFIDKLKVQKPLGSKREAPLHDLILQENSDAPDAKKVLAEFSAYLANYPHVIEAETISKHGQFTQLVKDGSHTLQIKKGNTYVSLLEDVDSLTIESSPVTDATIVTYTKDAMRGTLTISSQGDILNKVIRTDIYLNEPTFDAQGVGIVQHKGNKKRGFATLVGDTIHDLGTEQYEKLQVLDGGFYLATDEKKSYLCIPLSKHNEIKSQEIQKVFDDRIYVQERVSAILVVLPSGDDKVVALCDGVVYEHVFEEGIYSTEKQIKEEFKAIGSIIRYFDVTGKNKKTKKETATGKTIHQILQDGKIVHTPPLKEILCMHAGKFCVGVDTTGKLVNYELTEKGRDDKIGEITYWGAQKNGASEIYFGYSVSHKITAYALQGDKMTLVPVAQYMQAIDIPGFGKIMIGGDLRLCQQGEKGEVTFASYEKISDDPKSYRGVSYYTFQTKEGKYGIGRVVNNKREEFLPATSATEPNFQKESFSIGNNTYNLNSKGDFIKLEHDFDTLIGLDQPGWYCVAKGNKYGIAHMVDGKIQLTGNLEYDASPYIKENRCVIKKGATYELRDISAGRAKKKSYETTYEPIMTHIKRGYVVFDVPKEGLALVPLADVQTQKTLKANQCYEEIVKSSGVSGMTEREYFKMKKKNGGYDFLIDGKLLSTVSSASDLFEMENVQKINDDQRIIIGGPHRKSAIYFNNQGSISKLSSRNFEESRELDKTSLKVGDVDRDQYLYCLKDTGYGGKNPVEYIIIRNLPNDLLTTVLRPKPKKNKAYVQDDFECAEGKLYYAGENGSAFNKLFFMTNKLEDNMETIATFGIGAEREVEEDDMTKI